MPKMLTTRKSIRLAQDNLNFLLSNVQVPCTHLALSAEHKISANRFFKANSTQRLKTYLQAILDELSEDLDKKQFPQLQLSLQRLLHVRPQLANELGLQIPEQWVRKELSAIKYELTAPGNQLHRQKDQLVLINYDPETGLYTSPDDEKAHQHGHEATRIFLATQLERLKSLINTVFAKMGIYVFENASYEEHDYLHTDVYANDLAVDPYEDEVSSHFWVGHATNLIKIPTDVGPLHVLTDPVEGHLNALLYPRMTTEANKVKDTHKPMLPKVDVVVISHNHRDHVDIATLQLLVEQQPLMIIPEGDLKLFQDLGFTNVVELKWWEETAIQYQDNELMRITAVPTKHWSGRGLCDAHHSAFNGYVFQALTLEGDLYFAGDTALMEEKTFAPIAERFNIRVSIQPGGPDELREDMKSTHQSSADAILVHFKLLFAHYKKLATQEKEAEAFLETSKTIKTIYNHTATFKLGNLRLRDTFYSVNRLIAAFQEDEAWRKANLHSYELEVFNGIEALVQQMVFADQQRLSSAQIVDILLNSIIMPKIGERFDLKNPELATKSPKMNYRNLILNKRALVEYDELTQIFLENTTAENFNLNDLIIKLLQTYDTPWHSSFSRAHSSSALPIAAINTCEHPEALLTLLHNFEHNLQPLNIHGHMHSLLNYARWLTHTAMQQNSHDALHEFFICQNIKRQVDSEIKHYGSFSWFAESRNEKQALFTDLANKLEQLPCEVKAYKDNINQWYSNLASADGHPLHHHRFFACDKPRSQKTVENIVTSLELG